MTPEEYEQQVAEYFTKQGYDVELSPYTNDYGVDVFASKGEEKIAIQAKMYGSGIRPINRQMVMELCGAMHYFDCNSAKFVTDGRILSDAKKVADKLNIEIIALKPKENLVISKSNNDSFSNIWEVYVMPLEGKTIKKENGKENKIVSVDWSGIKRTTSNGKTGTIKIEIFKLVINHLKEHKEITRKAINEEYLGRASSGICLILSQLPFIEYIKTKPSKLVWRK